MFHHRRRMQVLDSYEVIGQPVVTSTGLSYVPWIDQAVRPYRATRVPTGVASGLSGRISLSPAVPVTPAV